MKNTQSKLCLGTVQWGLSYGIGNSTGRPSIEEIKLMLDAAHNAGVGLLDTARMYGESEKIIGELNTDRFQVVTKLPPLPENPTSNFFLELKDSFDLSIKNLNTNQIYGLLIHKSTDLTGKNDKEFSDFLQALRKSGKTQKIGVSIYEFNEIDQILKVFKPDIVQLPLNVFDQRLVRNGTLKKLKSLGIEIHARSVFLQGLLLIEPNKMDNYFQPITHLLNLWRKKVKEQGMTLTEAAISFVKQTLEVDKIIVGAESLLQLKQIISAFDSSRVFDAQGIYLDDPKWIDPRKWELK